MNFFLLLAGILLAYFIYTRIIRMYLKKWYYESQGVVFVKGVVPVLGNLPRFKKIMDKGINDVPWFTCINEDMGGGKLPKVIGLFNSYEVSLFITDPEMMNEVYLNKNKHFEKHSFFANVTRPLLGETMVFQRSDENWREKRRAFSSVFYKEKLIRLIHNIKEPTKRMLSKFR